MYTFKVQKYTFKVKKYTSRVQMYTFKVQSNFRNLGNRISGIRNLLNTFGSRNPVPGTGSFPEPPQLAQNTPKSILRKDPIAFCCWGKKTLTWHRIAPRLVRRLVTWSTFSFPVFAYVCAVLPLQQVLLISGRFPGVFLKTSYEHHRIHLILQSYLPGFRSNLRWKPSGKLTWRHGKSTMLMGPI